MDSTAQNLPGSFATPNEAMDTTVAHSHGTVRARSRTPEAIMREAFRNESGVVKKGPSHGTRRIGNTGSVKEMR